MGYIKHHAIIVTGWQYDKVIAANEKAKQIFKDSFKTSLAAEKIKVISDVIEGVVNAQYSFFIAPDGSKEGWSDSDFADNARAKFIKWIKSGEAGYVEYAEICFGGDDSENTFVNVSNKFAEI